MSKTKYRIILTALNNPQQSSLITLNAFDTIKDIKLYLLNKYRLSILQIALSYNAKPLLNDNVTLREISQGKSQFEVFYKSSVNNKELNQTKSNNSNTEANAKNIEYNDDNEEEEEEVNDDEESDDGSFKIHTLDDFFKIADDKEKKKQQLLGKKMSRSLANDLYYKDNNINKNNILNVNKLSKREFKPNLQEFLDLFKETQYPIVYKTIRNQSDINQSETKVNLNTIIDSLHIKTTSVTLEELTSPHTQSESQPLKQKPLSNDNTLSDLMIKPVKPVLIQKQPILHKPQSKPKPKPNLKPDDNNVSVSTYKKSQNIQTQFQLLLQSPKWSSNDYQTANSILSSINQIQINSNPNNDSKAKPKLNIVFDLDNTLIFSGLTSSVTFSENLINIQCITEQGTFYTTIVFRKGIETFIQSTKSFSTYHVYSLGLVSYVDQIIKELEKKFNIKIARWKGRKNREAEKNLSLLLPEQKDRDLCVIIDDLNRPWNSYYNYIINSMKFIDSCFVDNKIKRFSIWDFGPIHYNCSEEDNWTEIQFNPHQTFIGDNVDEYNIPLHVEYNYTQKNQLDYLGDVMRRIYLIAINAQVSTDKAIAFIRKTILMGCVFSLDYCSSNHDIIQMIITLGGSIYDNQTSSNDILITHMVISSNNKQKYIENKDSIPLSVCIVNNKYVFHCYYFLTKMNEKDSEYRP